MPMNAEEHAAWLKSAAGQAWTAAQTKKEQMVEQVKAASADVTQQVKAASADVTQQVKAASAGVTEQVKAAGEEAVKVVAEAATPQAGKQSLLKRLWGAPKDGEPSNKYQVRHVLIVIAVVLAMAVLLVNLAVGAVTTGGVSEQPQPTKTTPGKLAGPDNGGGPSFNNRGLGAAPAGASPTTQPGGLGGGFGTPVPGAQPQGNDGFTFTYNGMEAAAQEFANDPNLSKLIQNGRVGLYDYAVVMTSRQPGANIQIDWNQPLGPQDPFQYKTGKFAQCVYWVSIDIVSDPTSAGEQFSKANGAWSGQVTVKPGWQACMAGR